MAEPIPHVDVTIEDRSGRFVMLVRPKASLERIAGGMAFTEGPVWRGDHLIFSDIPNDRLCRWRELPEGPELTTFRAWNGKTNGTTLDKQGRLLACTHAARAVLRFDQHNQPTPIATHFDGKRLNSPNDLVVNRDGDIYFTDPPYGIVDQGPEAQEQPVNGVYRLTPAGEVELLTDRFNRPNGLAFAPNGRTLYIGDSGGPRDVWAFDVAGDGTLSNERQFVDMDSSDAPNHPDGMKCDVEGRLWSTGPGGVWVMEPDGDVAGIIKLPEQPANLAWGGDDWSTLFITARSSVYRLKAEVPGVAVP